jgi:hypothetical protein
MCSGSEAGSYSRLIGFAHHSALGLIESNQEDELARLNSRLSGTLSWTMFWSRSAIDCVGFGFRPALGFGVYGLH